MRWACGGAGLTVQAEYPQKRFNLKTVLSVISCQL